ncbi:hypothetical protein Pcinc_007087 [Petrolisthes cinctipes]|uniref:MARVEL domain-containing protein n=1 Tax=Petrolisthes cinctipes TaxID=88211 RepID=A0AAE1GFY5_PETCI|nr:hypothetical protein Pcinc_007087 [Petrolisthes cinctipes]
MIQFQLDIVRTPTGFFKLCEIALTIITLCVGEGTKDFLYGFSHHRSFFCAGVLMISMVITPLFFVTYFLGYSRHVQQTPLEVMYNGVVSCFMVSAGGILLHTFCTHPGMDLPFTDAGKTVASFCLINSIFYGVDLFFAYQAMGHTDLPN